MAKLSAAQRLRVRRATRHGEREPEGNEGELNIVPLLDVVVNLMLFMLATAAATMAVAQVDAESPSTCRGPRCGHAPEGLVLSVTITEREMLVTGHAGGFGPDCAATSAGPASRVAEPAALSRCLARVHARYPAERDVILTADPAVPFEALVLAMDAARESGLASRISAGVR